ncbi:hypothetical protein GOODEAATRI_003740 [Goodea atripinnis]|uniref:Sorting nexin-1 n=1 Tax=Goodea atripinnis TaxID=208336 RepID=A0ABV0N7L7_9TELE
MATGSERSPPPFPDSEDQDALDSEEVRARDSDEDDGEELFLSAELSPTCPQKARSCIKQRLPKSFILSTNTPMAKKENTSAPASHSVDLMSDPLIEPLSSQTENKSPSELFEDLTNDINITAEGASTAENPFGEASDDFVDILGSKAPAQREEVDVTVEATADKGDVSGGATELFGDGKMRSAVQEPTSTAPVMDLSDNLSASALQLPPGSAKIPNPLVDLLGDSPAASDAQKPSGAVTDLFDDEGSDIFTGPLPSKSAKQPQKSLFGEANEDLFGEPLGAVSKKATSKEQKEKPVTAGAAAAGGLPSGGNPAEPGDIFSEEAVSALPNARNTRAVNSRTNGVHSEEDSDIFGGDGMNAYMAYKVSTQTTLPMFRNKTFTVRRRFSDFLGLYEKLSEKHGPNGLIWFEEKLQEVESADQQFRKLHALVESLVIHRKELSLSTASFAKSAAMLGSAEDNTALSRALSQLAEVEDKIEQLHQDQAAIDTFSFAELIADFIRLLGAVRVLPELLQKTQNRLL